LTGQLNWKKTWHTFYNRYVLYFKTLNHVPLLPVKQIKLKVMKKLIYAFGSLVLFMGCKNNKTPLDTNKNMVLVDTTGLSKGSILSDTAKANHLKPGVTSTTSSTTTTTTTTTTTSNGAAKAPVHKSSGSSTKSGSSNSNSSTASAPAPDNRDKGWSDAAKGTAIGAGSGAVIGAVVSKNKAAGAIIGGVVGGGAGYAIGRSKDRKSGRVARKRKTY
jgi:hypothetical protein